MPATSGSRSPTPYTGERYLNGVIPQSAMTPFAVKVLADLPAVNRSGISNNYESLPGQTDQNDKGDIRYDQYVGEKFTGFFRYSHRLMNNFEPPAIPGPSGGNSNGNVRTLNYQAAFGGTYTISPRSVFEFRMAVGQTEGGKFPVFIGQPTVDKTYGITGLPTDPRFAGGLYAQSVGGYTQFGQQSSNPQFQNPSVINPKANYSHVGRTPYPQGRIRVAAALPPRSTTSTPSMVRITTAAASPSPPASAVRTTCTIVADFMFGLRNSYQLNNAIIVNYRQRMNFLYLQDDFKVSRKLTLNLGMRYEYATPQWERDMILSNFDPVNKTLIRSTNGGIYDRALVKPDRNNWEPRLGLAYNITPENRHPQRFWSQPHSLQPAGRREPARL